MNTILATRSKSKMLESKFDVPPTSELKCSKTRYATSIFLFFNFRAIKISEKPSPNKKSNPNARYNLNWDEYGSHDDFNEFIEEIASENSWASVRSIGKSVEGRDMKVLELTKGGPGAPNIFIEAGKSKVC